MLSEAGNKARCNSDYGSWSWSLLESYFTKTLHIIWKDEVHYFPLNKSADKLFISNVTLDHVWRSLNLAKLDLGHVSDQI